MPCVAQDGSASCGAGSGPRTQAGARRAWGRFVSQRRGAGGRVVCRLAMIVRGRAGHWSSVRKFPREEALEERDMFDASRLLDESA
jgi:hypothetical protein